jgi:1-acyl-sn-glycerol-3-phosphate acyltransferase
LLYKILLIPARIFIHFYCRKIIINDNRNLEKPGPLLIAANHPNSFLDAIIVATLFKNPVYSLTRGDVFKSSAVTKILRALHMLPVYRVSEGTENLEHNYSTFAQCQDIFGKKGIVLIFSEGQCVNEWHLRSLKKGTARIALDAWQHDTPLQVLPLGINYSSFRKFGKTLILNFGTGITRDQITGDVTNGKTLLEFNHILKEQLRQLVFEIGPHEPDKHRQKFHSPQSIGSKMALFLPALAGMVLHFPLYLPVHLILRNRAKDHYDSIMVGLLFFVYPVYVALFSLFVFAATGHAVAFLLLAAIPFSGWSYVQWDKDQTSHLSFGVWGF